MNNFPENKITRQGNEIFHKDSEETFDEKMNWMYAAIVEFSDDAIISKTLDGIITSWNKGAEKMYGYTSEEVVGKCIDIIMPPELPDELFIIMNKVKAGKQIEHYETVRIKKDGRRINISVTVSPIKNKDGKIIAASAIARDITINKKLEEEGKKKEKELIEAQKIAHLGYWEWDLSTNLLSWSEELYKMFELSPASGGLTYDKYMNLVHPDDTDMLKGVLENAASDHKPFKIDHRVILSNNTIHYILGNGEVILDENGVVVRMRGVAQDITDRKRTERRLSAQFDITKVLSEASCISEAVPQILKLICESVDWQVGEYWSVDEKNNLLQLGGYWATESIVANEFLETSKKCKFGPGVSLQGRVWEQKKPLWSSNIIEEQFFPRSKLASNLKLHSAIAFPIMTKEQVLGVFTFYKEDVAEPDKELLKLLETLGTQIAEFIERKKSEPALLESKQLYKTLVDISPDAITLTDLSGKIIYCNQRTAELFGFGEIGNIIGQNFYTFITPEDESKAIDSENKTIKEGSTRDIQYTFIKKDGTRFFAEVNTSLLLDPEGKPKAFIGDIRDNTKRKNIEEKLAASLDVVEQARKQSDESRKKLQFLAEASNILNSSLDYHSTLASVAELITPKLADWCLIDLLNQNNELVRIAASNIQQDKTQLAQAVLKKITANPKATKGVYKVLKTGKPEIYSHIDDPFLIEYSKDDAQLKLLREMGIKSVMIVPLHARGKILGTIILISSDSGRIFNSMDLTITEDLAYRAGLAIDNAQLYREAKKLNEELEMKVNERTKQYEISNLELQKEVKNRKEIEEELRIRVHQQSIIAKLGQVALKSNDLSELMHTVVVEITKTLKIEFTKVMEHISEKKYFVLRSGVGWKEGYVGNAIVKDKKDSQAGFTFSVKEPVVVTDFRTETRFKIPSLLQEHNVLSGISVIIYEHDKKYGILGAHSVKSRNFTQDDVNFLQAGANIIGSAIEKEQEEFKFRALLEANPDAALIVDKEGIILMANSSTEILFEYEKAKMIGNHFEILIPERYRKKQLQNILSYLNDPHDQIIADGLNILGIKKHGDEIPIQIFFSSLNIETAKLILVTIRDKK